ncbi:MAG: hypothetical protein OES15_08855, partial [Nitrosopumilus sp.]|nr:hypothetical protein [Nitrosopumilus sp.]
MLFGSIAFVPISSYATTFSLEFGASGNDEGEFDKLSNVVFDTSNDLMYVADTDNNRIQIFDLDGSCSGSDELANDICFIEEFGTSGNDEGEFDAPSGLALNTSD